MEQAMFGAARRWLARVPRAWESAKDDVDAVLKNDPAARSPLEVALVYPGVHALWMHRVAHVLWTDGFGLSARVLGHANRFLTGIEIHPGATLGRRVVIDHGMGVVIGETARVGDGCLLYKGVVLGGTKLQRTQRHPQLGAGVVVGSNACILGNIVVGDGARIGSGSVVVRSVPAGATVVGVPARIITPARTPLEQSLDHANLPDPVTDMIRSLASEDARLRRRVARLEEALDLDRDAQDASEPDLTPLDSPDFDGG
jgi:serine O-acetyltransferase